MNRFTFTIGVTFAIFFFSVPGLCQHGGLSVKQLRTEYKINPVTDARQPRLSWELVSAERGQVQTAYQIMVATSPALLANENPDLWDSKKTEGNASNQIEYAGQLLASRLICYWKVRAWDKTGKISAWSSTARWEMALLATGDWKASWIGNDLSALGKGPVYHLPPAPYFRKTAVVNAVIKKARLYVSSLGLYEFHINGKRIGDDYFTPGWTDYNKRVYYQTYDVTRDLIKGKNAVGAVVSDGWYAGYLGYSLLVGNPVVRNFYGTVPLLKTQIEIEYTNGKKEMILSDSSWTSAHGPLVESDILNGETYDARLAFAGWDSPSFRDAGWKNAAVYPDTSPRKLELYPGEPVKRMMELKALSVTARPGGKYIINLGQNFAGVVRLKVKGRSGDSIVLRYGEVLFPDGGLMTENLRKARATDTYIIKGDAGEETWTPQFTYHGFQYVEIAGLRYTPSKDVITGIVMTSNTPETGTLETDNALINQLYKNIVWTQRSNYFDIPTDCPQRDERLGWTGDAQTYILSATYNTDIASFFNKWLVDLNDAQRPDDTYPIYAPAPNLRSTDTYSPGWSEAGIICPYIIYRTYGDIRMIQKFWPNMLAYMKFLEVKSKGRYVFPEASFEDISPKGGFGDWLSVGKKTPPDMIATMYYAYCALMMGEMATAIHQEKEAAIFTGIFVKIKKAFLKHYSDTDGKLTTDAAAYGTGEGYIDGNMGFDGHTQTAYANAIYIAMLDSSLNQKAGNWLVELIRTNGGKLSTGFLGVKPLLPALSATGHSDAAYKLLLSTEYPSWGFEVVNGANTIWERWNSYIKGKGFENNAEMNSFNHYAFGSVNEWLFGNMAGLKVGEAGYRTVIIRPEIATEKINYVKATMHSINGEFISSWKKQGNKLLMSVTIPANTKAEIHIPASGSQYVWEGKTLIAGSKDVKIKQYKDGHLIVAAGSGEYLFTVTR